MTSPVRRERYALCDTFEAVGPDAPTLCTPWRTRDLAAHLVIREGRPDAAVGLLVPPLAQRAQRVQDGYAAGSWPELVERVRTGPPPWSPTRFEAVDAVVNLAELFIHHEDVLRAAARLGAAAAARRPRAGPLVDADAHRPAPLPPLAGGRGAGDARPRPAAGAQRARGCGSVVLRGTPGELLLHASGRQSVARVVVEGPDEALAAFTGTDLRL